MFAHSSKIFLATLLMCYCSVSIGQYERPEDAARKKAELISQEKEAEVNSYVGKTYWYVPNPNAISRLKFFDKMPSKSLDSFKGDFNPTNTTSFIVSGVKKFSRIPNYPSLDEYYLAIKFADEKDGYIKLDDLAKHLTKGMKYDFEEYLYTKSPQVAAAEQAAAAKNRAAEQAAAAKNRAAEQAAAAKNRATAQEALERAKKKKQESESKLKSL